IPGTSLTYPFFHPIRPATFTKVLSPASPGHDASKFTKASLHYNRSGLFPEAVEVAFFPGAEGPMGMGELNRKYGLGVSHARAESSPAQIGIPAVQLDPFNEMRRFVGVGQ